MPGKYIGDVEAHGVQMEIYECEKYGFHLGIDATFLRTSRQGDTEVVWFTQHCA
jgi:hypothetical protein